MARADRSTRWQLTENNADYDKQALVERLCSLGVAVYCVACSEVGESGTSHLHAFVVYKNAISLTSMKEAFPRAHFEHCRGSNSENRDYIQKSDEDYFEVGTMPFTCKGDEVCDIASEVVALIIEGKHPTTIARENAHLCDYVVKNFKNLVAIYLDLINVR